LVDVTNRHADDLLAAYNGAVNAPQTPCLITELNPIPIGLQTAESESVQPCLKYLLAIAGLEIKANQRSLCRSTNFRAYMNLTLNVKALPLLRALILDRIMDRLQVSSLDEGRGSTRMSMRASVIGAFAYRNPTLGRPMRSQTLRCSSAIEQSLTELFCDSSLLCGPPFRPHSWHLARRRRPGGLSSAKFYFINYIERRLRERPRLHAEPTERLTVHASAPPSLSALRRTRVATAIGTGLRMPGGPAAAVLRRPQLIQEGDELLLHWQRRNLNS